LLVHQLDRLETYLDQKEEIAQRYNEGFKNNAHLKIPAVLPDSKHARHLYTIWVDAAKRDEYMNQLQEAGLGVAVNFRALHLMSFYVNKYGYKKGYFSNCEAIGDATITLPFYPRLSEDEIQYIIDSVNKVVIG
jgi:dTDP-4-amino-4,6-dideoxygalactose transaminase